MSIASDKQKLKEEGIDIKGNLAGRLRASNFQCLVKYLEDDNFKATLQIIVNERNERADVNLKVNREHTSAVAQVNRLKKELLNFQKSEIYQAGKWLLNALSKNGNDRQKSLIERDLVYKEDHNRVVVDQRDSIRLMDKTTKEAQEESNRTIVNLEKSIDNLKNILMKIKKVLKRIEKPYDCAELARLIDIIIDILRENDENNEKTGQL